MRRITAGSVVGAFLLASIVMLAQPAGAIVVCTDASLQGCWSVPFSEDGPDADSLGDFDTQTPETLEEAARFPTAVSIAVTPSGRTVYWDGLTGLEDSNAPLPLDAGNTADPAESRLLDLTGSSGVAWMDPSPIAGGSPDNLFCADQRVLASGKVIAAGGTDYRTDAAPVLEQPNPIDPSVGNAELYGSKNTRLYTDASGGGSWDYDAERDMANGRWYPTLVTQPDGDLLVAGGVRKLVWNTDGVNVAQTEVYDTDADSWTQNGEAGNASLPLYARMHLLPSGEVLYNGTGQMWGPAGQAIDEAVWNLHATYNTTTKSWRQGVGVGALGARSIPFSVLLPLTAPYDEAKMMVAGGTLGVSPSSYLATNTTEIITASDLDGDPTNGWETQAALAGNLNRARWFSSGVLLPNGHIVAVNGADKDEVIMPGTEAAVRDTEIWDGSEWNLAAPSGRDRTYHNSAVLLPDGTVLVGGHAPINRFYGDKASGDHDTMGFANNLRDPSFEIFYPPYLYDSTGAPAARPNVLSGNNAAHNGGPLTLAMGSGGPAVDKVVLYRLPSATHATDADQRSIELAPTPVGPNLQVTVPDSTAVVPPGWYYVFAVTADGVPSVAFTTQITPDDGSFAAATGVSTPIHITPMPLRDPVHVPASRGTSDTATVAGDAAGTTAPAPRTPVFSLPAAERAAQTVPSAGLVALTMLALAALGRRAHRVVRARS